MNFFTQITARETLGRQRLKAAVKQPPIIDPKTGQEVIIEPEGPSTKDTDGLSDTSDETSDIEVEYFETEVCIGQLTHGFDWCFSYLISLFLQKSMSAALKPNRHSFISSYRTYKLNLHR